MNKKAIQEQLQSKILLLDGAMGTMLQAENLTAEDFGENNSRGVMNIYH